MVSAIFKGKCPKCRQGRLFKYPLIHFRFAEMNKKCAVCEVSFVPEPGFYIGAMYISYAFNVALLVVVGIALYALTDQASDWVYISSIVATSFLLIPFSFRYSRILFLYAFGGISYQRK
jgi:uncharacterized protein (DUF983 family)